MNPTAGAEVSIDPAIAAVKVLARELEMPVEQVERVYRAEASKIEAEARIWTFVPVIVASRVRAELLRQRRIS